MVNVLERPIFPPYQCLVCGVGDPRQRKWFVDTQLNLDNLFNPQNHGSIYLCNECWDGMAVEIAKAAQVFVIGQVPWEDGEYVEPTYDSTEELVDDGPGFELSNTGVSDSEPEGVDNDSTSDSSDTEGGDPDPDADTNDGESDPVSDFRGLFGNNP